MKNQEQKREEAKQRLDKYQTLTTAEKIAALDAAFGVGQGAKKQRARLASESEKKS